MGEKKSKLAKKLDPSKLANLPPEDILQNFINPIAKKCAEELEASFLVLYYPESTQVAMYAPSVSLVYALLRGIDKDKPLAVFIHSAGGDIHTAYKLATLFHKYCKYMSVIPEYAKSAATLVAIAADKILMSPIAELGPLDPIVHFSDGETIPAFAIRNAPKTLEKEIESCKDSEVRKLKAEHILGPIAVKIDPYILSSVQDIPSLVKSYGKKLLITRGYKSTAADRIVGKLTELGRSSHGYVVDLEESKSLGVRAEDMGDEVESKTLALLHLLRMYEFACKRNEHAINTPIIRIYPFEKKKRKAGKKAKTKPKEKKEA